MRDYAILADITSDLSEEICTRFNLKYVSGHFTDASGKEYPTKTDWNSISHDEFYSLLKKDPKSFTSAPPSVKEFENAFTEELEKGKDVICFTLSSQMSGTYNFACSAKNGLVEKYPDQKIIIVDSRRFGPGFGLMCVWASELRKEGKTIEEVESFFEENKNRFHQMGWLDDLQFIAKKGRLTNSKAFFGTLIGIKPLGDFDYNGMTTVLGKVKGEKKAYDVILDYIEKTGENLSGQIIFIAQTDREKQAQILKQKIQERFAPKEILVCDVYVATGINVGPGLMAAYYFGKPASEELIKEKELMENLING